MVGRHSSLVVGDEQHHHASVVVVVCQCDAQALHPHEVDDVVAGVHVAGVRVVVDVVVVDVGRGDRGGGEMHQLKWRRIFFYEN